MMSVSDTLWALAEVFGDRQEIIDGVCFVGLMTFGPLTLLLAWS